MTASYKFDVIEAIAEAEGQNPVQLTPPIGTVVNLDALETCLADTDDTCWATFTYKGHVISVSSDREVEFSQLASH